MTELSKTPLRKINIQPQIDTDDRVVEAPCTLASVYYL